MECKGQGYTGANMSVPYFGDGKAQMKKVKETKEKEKENEGMIKKIDLVLDYMKKNNLTEISRKQAETVMDTTYVTARSLLYKSDLFRHENGIWILLKEQEMINMPYGKSVCGLNGCTELVPNKNQKSHACEFHNMTLEEYKIARKQQKSKESAVKRMEKEPIDLEKEVKETPEDNIFKPSELIPEYPDPASIPEPEKTTVDSEILTKEDANKATEEITEQNERHKTKEIIQVVILRCPHCGGKLKMKE